MKHNVQTALGPVSDAPITIATAYGESADAALGELAAQTREQTACFGLLFLPNDFDAEAVQEGIDRHLSKLTLFGCSSAGQITPEGYENDAYLLILFPRTHFHIASCLISPLDAISLELLAPKLENHSRQFRKTAGWRRLGLLFCDGKSKQEDVLAAAIAEVLPELQVFGGSAARLEQGKPTQIIAGGKLHDNSALLLFLETDLEFEAICFDHFVPTDRRMVVTRARANERIVEEINGQSAAAEYARITGVAPKDLSVEVFSQNPLLFKEGHDYHVRSISHVTENGGLELFCSIDVGVVLTLGSGEEIVRTLEKGLEHISGAAIPPAFILGFDCFLRRLEIEYRQRTKRASAALQANKVIGFNTYGEQHHGIHVNQTFVGIAFYPPSPAEPL